MAFLDKAIRLVRYFVTSMGNHATLTALPNGATRVRLHRPIRSAPGSHVFLWLPAIRLTQSHPFTLVSTNPVEFVVRSHRGFTSDLYQYAQKHGQDKKIRCALNGPYGLPTQDLALYDSVLLVAGGSGASFTFAVGLNLARGISIRENPMRFLFIWVVRTKSESEILPLKGHAI
jgi:NAD(P)H-flavin reductase